MTVTLHCTELGLDGLVLKLAGALERLVHTSVQKKTFLFVIALDFYCFLLMHTLEAMDFTVFFMNCNFGVKCMQ